MQGRIESDERWKQHIEEQLKERPYYLSDWFLSLQANQMTMKTCYTYLNKVNHFLDFMKQRKNVIGLDLNDITLADISAYFITIQYKIDNNGSKIKTSNAYIQSVWYALNKFFNFCVKNGNCTKNLVQDEKPKLKPENKANKKPLLTANDFEKMLMYTPGNGDVKKRNKAILLLYMTTGMRKDALCQINTEDIDFEHGILSVIDKGEKPLVYHLQDDILSALNDWLDVRNDYAGTESNALFISNQGKRISNSAIAKLVGQVSQQALGYKISPHKLRSGFCSILYNQTHDIEFVRRSVGHETVETTRKYIITENNETAKASNIMAQVLKLT